MTGGARATRRQGKVRADNGEAGGGGDHAAHIHHLPVAHEACSHATQSRQALLAFRAAHKARRRSGSTTRTTRAPASGMPSCDALTQNPLMNMKLKPARSMRRALRPSWAHGPCTDVRQCKGGGAQACQSSGRAGNCYAERQCWMIVLAAGERVFDLAWREPSLTVKMPRRLGNRIASHQMESRALQQPLELGGSAAEVCTGCPAFDGSSANQRQSP